MLIDYFAESTKRFGALRYLVSEDLKIMIHIGPGLQNHVSPLTLRARGKCGNAVVKNLSTTGLNVDWRNIPQISIDRRNIRISALSGRTEPIGPLNQHGWGNPIEGFVADEAGAASVGFGRRFKIGWRGERKNQLRQRKFQVARQ